MTGIVFDIKKFAVHDGPGIRTTIFLKGCPLKCQWCHNPESINPACETIIKINRKKALDLSYSETKEVFGKEVTVDEIFNEVKKDMLFYDDGGGVTFSGGEPMMQPDFLIELLKKCKYEDFHTVVDTSGLAKWEDFERVIPHTNLFLYDLKIIDDDEHKKYTGISNKQILENLKKLTEAGSRVRIRIPLIPEITDTEENLIAILEYTARLKNVEGIDILPFNKIYEGKYHKMNLENKLKNLEKQTDEKLNKIKCDLEAGGFNVQIGG